MIDLSGIFSKLSRNAALVATGSSIYLLLCVYVYNYFFFFNIDFPHSMFFDVPMMFYLKSIFISWTLLFLFIISFILIPYWVTNSLMCRISTTKYRQFKKFNILFITYMISAFLVLSISFSYLLILDPPFVDDDRVISLLFFGCFGLILLLNIFLGTKFPLSKSICVYKNILRFNLFLTSILIPITILSFISVVAFIDSEMITTGSSGSYQVIIDFKEPSDLNNKTFILIMKYGGNYYLAEPSNKEHVDCIIVSENTIRSVTIRKNI